MTVYAWEVGRQMPSKQAIPGICNALNCQPWQLMHPDPQWASDMILLGRTSGRLCEPTPDPNEPEQEFIWANIPIEPKVATERDRVYEKHHGSASRRTA